MKKLLSLILAFVLVASIVTVPVFASDDVKVVVNGKEVKFDQPPVITDGRTLVPARAVFEALGASVYWDPTEDGGYVSVVTNTKSIVINVSTKAPESYMIIDNTVKMAIDVPASIINGRTLVPLRAIGDALSSEVGWDGETRTASLELVLPETDVLSAEANTANSELTYEKAASEIKEQFGAVVENKMPLYKNGIKYYNAISYEAEKNYVKEAGKAATAEEYPVFILAGDVAITEAELEYYHMMYMDETGKVSEENMILAENDAKELAVTAYQAIKLGVKKDAEFESAVEYYIYSMCYGMDISTFSSMTGVAPETIYSLAEKFAYRNALYNICMQSGEIDVSEEKVEAEFEKMFYKAKHILVKTVDDEMNKLPAKELKEKEKLIKSILTKLRNGGDFDKLMKQYTEDGEQSLIGYVFTDGQMVEPFENAVKELKPGKISDIVETEYGYHIILRMELSAKEEAETLEYYKQAIQNQIATDFFKENAVKWGKEIGIEF